MQKYEIATKKFSELKDKIENYSEIENYKNGKLEGLAKDYYENGNLKAEENYKAPRHLRRPLSFDCRQIPRFPLSASQTPPSSFHHSLTLLQSYLLLLFLLHLIH